MELNPIEDNFEVKLPDKLILDSVFEKFSKLIEGRHFIHDDLFQYIAESIQSVDVPDFIADPVTVTGNGYQLNKRPFTNDLFRLGAFRIAISFRILDGFWNYWMFRTSYMQYIKNTENLLNDNVGNVTLKFFSNDRTWSYTVTLIKCVHGGIEGKEFSFVNEEVSKAQYFSVNLYFDDFQVDVQIPGFNDVVDEETGETTPATETNISFNANSNSQPGAVTQIIT